MWMEIISSLCEVLASEAQPLQDGPTERASGVNAGDVMCRQHVNCMPALPCSTCMSVFLGFCGGKVLFCCLFFFLKRLPLLFFLMFLCVHSKMPLIKYKMLKI